MSFLGEIKRRKVFQVAAVYAVVAWLLIQIVDVVNEPLRLPDWFDTIVIVLLAVGFPIAVILAWAFDITPQGIKSASDVQAESVRAHATGQRFGYISQALVLLAVGFLVVDQYLFDDVRRSGVAAGSRQSATPAVVRLMMVHPGTVPMNGATSDAKVAISPDGRHVAYLVGPQPSATLPLYVRALDRLEPLLLASSARSPFFSPDGQWVGFVEDNRKLSKVAITGGPSMPIGDLAGSVRGATWGSDDTIIFGTTDASTGLLSIPAAGGDTAILTTPDTTTGAGDHVYPDALPEGRGVLFTITATEQIDNSQIALLDLETGEHRVLIRGGSYGTYSESGHIVYGAAGTLLAVPFDLERLAVSGDPVPVLDGVVASSSGSAGFSLAPNGTLVYLTGSAPDQSRTMVWVDRAGREEPLAADVQPYFEQRLSPDGQRIALAVGARSEADIWIYDLLRGTTSRLTFDGSSNIAPLWSPDGNRVLFSSTRRGGGIYSKAADGTGQVEAMLAGEGEVWVSFFAPDRSRLVAERRVEGIDIQVVSIKDGTTNTLIGGQGNQEFASLSPDGRWIAYESDENGRDEIYIRPFPEVEGGKWQISTSGGNEPQWGPDGRELFFLGPDTMMVIDVESEPNISLGIPEPLFSTAAYVDDHSALSYSISPDGQRFLMFKPATATGLYRLDSSAFTQLSMVVVQNWFEELKQLAPTGN